MLCTVLVMYTGKTCVFGPQNQSPPLLSMSTLAKVVKFLIMFRGKVDEGHTKIAYRHMDEVVN